MRSRSDLLIDPSYFDAINRVTTSEMGGAPFLIVTSGRLRSGSQGQVPNRYS